MSRAKYASLSTSWFMVFLLATIWAAWWPWVILSMGMTGWYVKKAIEAKP